MTSPLARLQEPLALGRAVVGVTLLTRPDLLPGLLGVDPPTSRRVSWVLQMLGAREVALGAGSAVAGRADGPAAHRTWLAAGMLCDAVDAVALAAAVGSGRVRRGSGLAVVVVAAGAVAVQADGLARRPRRLP